MSFIDERLDDTVERGAESSPTWSTSIFAAANGYEARNANRQEARREFNIAFGVDQVSILQGVISAHYAANGRLHSFRFKDWTDFEVGTAASPQQIGIGDASLTEFQAIKTYSFGSFSTNKTITKLVSGIEVYIDTTGLGSSWVLDGTATVDLDTGLVTPTSTPASGTLVGIAGEYDIHVRFDADRLPIQAIVLNGDGTVSNLPDINLIEVLSA